MKHTILVVDDQEEARDALAALLDQNHYLAEFAANGQEAIDRLRSGAPLPELMMLDLNMPIMDGWEVLFHIARDSSLRHLPVVILSGSPIVSDEIVVPLHVTFLAKPLRAAVVVNIIAEMLLHAGLASERLARALDRVRPPGATRR